MKCEKKKEWFKRKFIIFQVIVLAISSMNIFNNAIANTHTQKTDAGILYASASASPSPSPSPSPDYRIVADAILKGFFMIPPYGTFDFRKGIDWSNKTLNDRSYLRLLHSQGYLNDLTKAYKSSKNIDNKRNYILKSYDIINDWIVKNPYDKPANVMAWHDETTAKRLINWVHFYEVAKNILPPEKLSLLLHSMQFHAKLLASDKFYSKNTNHGMFQDEALLVYSNYFKDAKESHDYEVLAIKRLKNYFNFIISTDGVHKEHSPSYHSLIASSILQYQNFFQLKNDVELSNYFEKIYKKMAKYGTFVIKPDGKWPLLGDTFSSQMPLTFLWADDVNYQYAISMGSKGLPPAALDAVFPAGGYAIFRDSWEKKAEATYIHFAAAYHTDYHKHSDDLSVWIYSNGDIVTEAGPNGYNYQDPYTQYAYSSFAHNTLIVDDEGLPRVDGMFEKTHIKDYKLEKNQAMVSGVNQRFFGVVHLRTLTYTKDKQLLVVKDDIDSKTLHNYKLLWHFAPGLIPRVEGKKIIVKKGDKSVLEITFASSAKHFKIKEYYGENDPIYKSLQFNHHEKPTPTYMVVLEADADHIVINSAFHII